jgi:hypothetical protein
MPTFSCAFPNVVWRRPARSWHDRSFGHLDVYGPQGRGAAELMRAAMPSCHDRFGPIAAPCRYGALRGPFAPLMDEPFEQRPC